MVISPSLVDDTPCDEPGHELVNGQCLDLRADAGIPVDDGEDGQPPPDCAIPGGCLGDNPPGDGESGDEGDGNAEGEGDDDGDSNGSNNGDSGTEDGGGNEVEVEMSLLCSDNNISPSLLSYLAVLIYMYTRIV